MDIDRPNMVDKLAVKSMNRKLKVLQSWIFQFIVKLLGPNGRRIFNSLSCTLELELPINTKFFQHLVKFRTTVA
jgi:hypothetical protein